MSRSRSRTRRLMSTGGSVVVALLGGGLLAALPWFLGVSWAAIAADVARVPVLVLLGLATLWVSGLVVHAPVLRAAMPGLGVRQALTLNLAGSAVSNVLPVGGPAGMGLGYAMARSWGFRPDAFASYTVATNLWNALGKFAMGLAVLATAALLGVGLPSGLSAIVLSASAFMSAAAGTAFLTFRTEAVTVAVGHRIDQLIRLVRPNAPSHRCADWLLGTRNELAVAVRRGWKVMSAGVFTYLVLQAALLLACLAAVGAGAPVSVVLIAFAIERLISLAPITPGASGIAELGTVAALHFFGVGAVAAASGVLLYRAFMFAIEIPIGGALALHWLHRTRRVPVGDPLPQPDGSPADRVDLAPVAA